MFDCKLCPIKLVYIVTVMTTLHISVYTQVVFKYNCSVCILVTINDFFSYWTRKFLKLVPKVNVTEINQTYIKLHFNSHASYVKYLMKFVTEPGKHCLPKWYIENTNDYITLMLYISLVLACKNIQFHIFCSFYDSISINSTEVDPHSNSLHNGIVKPKNIVNVMKTKNLFKAPYINSIQKIKIFYFEYNSRI